MEKPNCGIKHKALMDEHSSGRILSHVVMKVMYNILFDFYKMRWIDNI